MRSSTVNVLTTGRGRVLPGAEHGRMWAEHARAVYIIGEGDTHGSVDAHCVVPSRKMRGA